MPILSYRLTRRTIRTITCPIIILITALSTIPLVKCPRQHRALTIGWWILIIRIPNWWCHIIFKFLLPNTPTAWLDLIRIRRKTSLPLLSPLPTKPRHPQPPRRLWHLTPCHLHSQHSIIIFTIIIIISSTAATAAPTTTTAAAASQFGFEEVAGWSSQAADECLHGLVSWPTT